MFTCVKYKENGESTKSLLDLMLTKIAYGNNSTAASNLNCLLIGFDRDYIFKPKISKLLKYGARLHSTVQRYVLNPFIYDKTLKAHDQRMLASLKGVQALKLKYAVFKSGSFAGNKVTFSAYRDGRDSVCTLMSTEYHANYWDVIPKNDYSLELYEIDQERRHNKGFKVCQKRVFGLNSYSSSLFEKNLVHF